MSMDMRTLNAPRTDRSRPRSLRLRLMLWYGTLLIVALGLFATLILLLTTNALNQSVDSAVRTEARLVSVAVTARLSSTSPYWPLQFSLPAIDTYRESGVVVEVVDTPERRLPPQIAPCTASRLRFSLTRARAQVRRVGRPLARRLPVRRPRMN